MTNNYQPRRLVCGAKTHWSGEPCKRWAMAGTTRCRSHGGASPQAQAKAREREATEKAQRALSKQMLQQGAGAVIPPVTDPLRVLSSLAGEIVALKDFFGSRLLSEGLTPAEISSYERALDRARSVLVDMGRLNLEERQVALDQRTAGIVIDAMATFAKAMGHNPSDLVVREVIRNSLLEANARSKAIDIKAGSR